MYRSYPTVGYHGFLYTGYHESSPFVEVISINSLKSITDRPNYFKPP